MYSNNQYISQQILIYMNNNNDNDMGSDSSDNDLLLSVSLFSDVTDGSDVGGWD